MFYNNNVTIIRKNWHIKELFNVFVKYISLLSFVVFLIEIIFFSNRKKNRHASFQYCLFFIYRRYRDYVNELYLKSFYSFRFNLELYNFFYNN